MFGRGAPRSIDRTQAPHVAVLDQPRRRTARAPRPGVILAATAGAARRSGSSRLWTRGRSKSSKGAAAARRSHLSGLCASARTAPVQRVMLRPWPTTCGSSEHANQHGTNDDRPQRRLADRRDRGFCRRARCAARPVRCRERGSAHRLRGGHALARAPCQLPGRTAEPCRRVAGARAARGRAPAGRPGACDAARAPDVAAGRCGALPAGGAGPFAGAQADRLLHGVAGRAGGRAQCRHRAQRQRPRRHGGPEGDQGRGRPDAGADTRHGPVPGHATQRHRGRRGRPGAGAAWDAGRLGQPPGPPAFGRRTRRRGRRRRPRSGRATERGARAGARAHRQRLSPLSPADAAAPAAPAHGAASAAAGSATTWRCSSNRPRRRRR